MDEDIKKILLSTSQSMKELKIINENVKKLDKKLSKIIFEEKKKIINKLYMKQSKKYFISSN
jgi:hypothetical protein